MQAAFPLVFAALLFCVGVFGVLSRRNAVLVLMSVELMLAAVTINLVTFGLLAELLARTYYESQNKPVYAIREVRQTPERVVVEG